ncbi:MAG: murein transglycosylase A [Pseudomonadota bacterium]
MQELTWRDLPHWPQGLGGADEADLNTVLPTFLQSCRGLSGKAQWPLWRSACEAGKALQESAAELNTASLRQFFEAHFTPYLLSNPDGSTHGLITGYYEPLLNGARAPSKQYAYPVLGVPDDLLTVELGDLIPELKHKRVRARLQDKKVVPYFSRAELLDRESAPEHHVLLWVDDPVALFFLQIQGSGRVKLPGGETIRVAYADQNGHPYRSIGRVLIERGELKPEFASMQGITAWVRANPNKLNELLNTNPSYVFFRELPAEYGAKLAIGPPGAMGVPVTAKRTLAIDPRYVPLGAPVFLATTQPNSAKPLRRLMFAQDTGGAIRGVVRADFFWGFGAEAGKAAGRMRQSGQMWVLLPPGVAAEK